MQKEHPKKIHHHSDHEHGSHEHTLYNELICHFPYAVFSVAIALTILSMIGAFSMGQMNLKLVKQNAHILFHSFHFMHILFASTGTVITYLRFAKGIIPAIIIGIVSPAIFCMLSDAVLPYIAGRMLGVEMSFHICFYSEFTNVLPFLLVGVMTGIFMSKHKGDHQPFYAATSHAVHIFVSSLASTFYLVSHGFSDWYLHIGAVFLALIFAVVVPCTLSDVVVPMSIAGANKKR